ncbi:MAG: hypothetical protein ABSH22_07310 [Tepidisphaeraceae bacterium]|jgi:hypothetical protein
MRLTLPTSALFDARVPERELANVPERTVEIPAAFPDRRPNKRLRIELSIFSVLLFMNVVKYVVLGAALGCG